MNSKHWQQVEEQLPQGAKVTKTYTAFENGETRLAVMLPGAQYETRYIVHFEGDDVKLEHRP